MIKFIAAKLSERRGGKPIELAELHIIGKRAKEIMKLAKALKISPDQAATRLDEIGVLFTGANTVNKFLPRNAKSSNFLSLRGAERRSNLVEQDPASSARLLRRFAPRNDNVNIASTKMKPMPKRELCERTLFIVIILFAFLDLFKSALILAHSPEPLPGWENSLPVDGYSYSVDAQRLIKRRQWLYTQDGFHSVGMQLLTAVIFRALGARPASFLLYNLLVWGLLLIAIAYACRRWHRSSAISALTILACLSSGLLTQYRGLIQYELTVSFLCLLWALLQGEPPSVARQVSAGFLTAVLAIFRAHFLVLLPFAMLRPKLANDPFYLRKSMAALMGFLFLAAPWNAFYSVKRGHLFLFQRNFTMQTLTGSLNAQSTGEIYPFQDPPPDSGLSFITKHPANYLSLLGRRAQFIFGLKPHIWFAESPMTLQISRLFRMNLEKARIALFVLASFLFAAGLFVATNTRRKGGHSALPFLFPAVVVIFPIVFINTASRLLTPAIPCILLMQSLAVDRAYGAISRSLSKWRLAFLSFRSARPT